MRPDDLQTAMPTRETPKSAANGGCRATGRGRLELRCIGLILMPTGVQRLANRLTQSGYREGIRTRCLSHSFPTPTMIKSWRN